MLKAVIIGALVDNIGTLLVMTTLAALLAQKGLSDDEVMARMKSTNGLLLGLILGLGFTMLGGFFAGRLAGKRETLHGALVALVGIVITIVFWEKGGPIWFDIAGFAGMLPAGIFGGFLAMRRPPRKQA